MKAKEEIVKEHEHDFESLVSIMDILRSDGGCPWDREQTHSSIRKCLIEETYEVVEAIDNDDCKLMREELGDLLFQVMFHSRIEKEKGNFDVNDVINGICKKMIYRHPHVFDSTFADSSEAVSMNWDELKKKEKKINTVSENLRKIPPSLPALVKAQKVIYKAKGKLNFTVEMADLNESSLAEKVFILCSEAEDLGIDLEKELNIVTDKFISCVELMENEK